MTKQIISSWGRLTHNAHDVVNPSRRSDLPRVLQAIAWPYLAYGKGRSYGDVCINSGFGLVGMELLDRFIAADWQNGVVRVEAGITIDELLRVVVPRGWFIPVTPGTKFVTLGGAIANDVHGKNQIHAGTFGRHVSRLGLWRSDGTERELSADNYPALFAATIGGLGLTGIITWVEFKLEPITSSFLDCETIRIGSIEDYFRCAENSRHWPFTIAWIDCLAGQKKAGSGLFTRARWAARGSLSTHQKPWLTLPVDCPVFLLNAHLVAAFNRLYQSRPHAIGRHTVHYDTFFYPLDSVANWNRLYGARGLLQHQSVIPSSAAPAVLSRMLELVAERRQGSFLTVVKEFGELASPGIISFPRPGTTFALDFPNTEAALTVVNRLADIAIEAGGRLYPAKDACMTAAQFQTSYPNWRQLEQSRDPAVLSDFWRRVTGIEGRWTA